MARSRSLIDRFSFGGRIPGGVGVVLVTTIATSLAVAFGERHAVELYKLIPLIPGLVLQGQIWRLVTWVLVEPEPLSLLFRCLMLYWLGRDLSQVWGSRRFLAVYFGTCLFAGAVTVLLSVIDPAIREQTYLGSWALDVAVLIAWGLHFPDRVIRIYFVIPIRGYVLAWGTVALTVAYSIFRGWEHFVHILAAEGGMLAWVYRVRLRKHWLKFRAASIQRKLASTRRGVVRKIAAMDDDDNEPLTEEQEAELRRVLGRTKPSSPPKPSDLN